MLWTFSRERPGNLATVVGIFLAVPEVVEDTMSKTAEADDRGRIVIPHEIREKHGDRYRVVELKDRIELIPLKEDPIVGLRNAVGDAFDEKPIEEIKRKSREAAQEDAINEVNRDHGSSLSYW
jgi:bifunctional DNA-binding transcriptional regulator/antitoxin component of YhaV-PrlF toxin-antitoxin module